MSTISTDTIEPLDIGDGDERFFYDSDEQGMVTVCFVDSLDFHEQYLERELTNEDLVRAEQKLTKAMPPKYDAEINLECGWHADGTEAFEVTLFMGNYFDREIEYLLDDAWGFIAECINFTDPGTFNHEYIFNEG